MGLLLIGSWWAELLFVLACAVLYGWYRLKKMYSYFEDHGIPTMPFWTSIKYSYKLLTLKMSNTDYFLYLYNYFDGHKFSGFYQIGGKGLLIRDPDLVNRVLIKDFSYFHDHGFDVDTDVNPLEGHLFNMNGQEWRALRNKLTPTFTTGKLRGMLPQMAECSDNLILLMKQIKPDEDVLIHDILSRFAIDVIASCAFGVEGGALKDPNCEFRRMANKFFRPTSISKWRTLFRSFFPRLALKLKMKTIDDEVTNFFMGITRQAFEHRMKTGLKRNDFVDLLLQLKLKGSVDCDPKELTEEDANISPGVTPSHTEEESQKLVFTDGLLAAQSFIFLAGGFENTATTMGFTLYLLAKNPDTQDKARREVREVMQRHEGKITYEALKEMVYLDACVSESLRLYNPGIGLLHSCTKPYKLNDDFVVEKGMVIVVPTAAMQRDPAYFYEPDEFRPERFMPDHEIPPNVYLPFGDGPRICIARRFVLLEVKQVLCKLLDNFKFRVSSKTLEPIQLSPSFFNLEPKGGLWLRIEPMSDAVM